MAWRLLREAGVGLYGWVSTNEGDEVDQKDDFYLPFSPISAIVVIWGLDEICGI
jgi:hypothetical protein